MSSLDLKASYQASLSVPEEYEFCQDHHFGSPHQHGWGATLPTPWQEKNPGQDEYGHALAYSHPTASSHELYPDPGAYSVYSDQQPASQTMSLLNHSQFLAQASQDKNNMNSQTRQRAGWANQHPLTPSSLHTTAHIGHSHAQEDASAHIHTQMQGATHTYGQHSDGQEQELSLGNNHIVDYYDRTQQHEALGQHQHQQQQETYQHWKQQHMPQYADPVGQPSKPSKQEVGGSMFTHWASTDSQELEQRQQQSQQGQQQQQEHKDISQAQRPVQPRRRSGQMCAASGGASQPAPSLNQNQQRPHPTLLPAVVPRQPTGGGLVVRMRRSQAWARFLAYEGCVQVRKL